MKERAPGSADSADSLVIDPITLFNRGSRHFWIPTLLITGISAYLAWRQGGNGLILSVMFVATAVAIGGGWILVRFFADRLPVRAQVVFVAGLIATQLSIIAWGYAYRGLEGGFWINLMTISFIAGILLETGPALVVGFTGSLSFLAIAILSDQADLAHLPTLAVGLPYIFALALLAAGHRRAITRMTTEQQSRHVEVLENSNLKMTAVIQSLTEGLLTTDASGRIERWNKALERLTGLSEMETVGVSVDEALPLYREGEKCTREDHPCVRALSGPVFDGSHSGDEARELVLLGRHGHKVPVTVSAAPLVADSTAAGVVAVVLDVTRERELGKLQETLISAVSHELRTPLTMILGFAEMLMTGDLSKYEQAECSRQISEAAQALNSLIEDLLSVSALEAGEMALNMRTVPVSSLVNSVLQTLPEADRPRIKCDVPQHLLIHGDPDRLSQVLYNLLDNALKFSDPGSEVTIEGGSDKAGTTVIVRDHGIGIDEHQVDLLFERFVRADNGRVASLSGTGLGLYVVKRVVALHGGKIEVSSELDVGTEISFTLPPH